MRYVVNENFFDDRPVDGARAAPAAGSGADQEQKAASPTPDRPEQAEVADQTPLPTGADETAERSAPPAEDVGAPEQSVPRLLGGAYYDSDAISDSE